jgi:hypothetical protein
MIIKKERKATLLSLLFAYCISWQDKFYTLLLLLLFFSPVFVSGQTLEDFKTAATTGEGVTLIPFADIRIDANRVAREVDRYKTEVKPFNFDLFEKQKNKLLEEIKKKKQDIEDEENIAKKHGTAIDVRRMKKLEETLSESTGKLNKLNEEIGNAAEAFKRLYNARAGLREYFDKVLEKLRDALSHPVKYLGKTASKADIEKMESYIKHIKGEIEFEAIEHKKQEDGAKGTWDAYDELINKTTV